MSCQIFRPNPMNTNSICRDCFKHKDSHPTADPFSEEKIYRMRIEDILYYSDTKEQSAEVNTYISKLLKKLPPPEEYFKVFNVYSYVRQNLTNPELIERSPVEKLAAIYRGVDLLLLVALPLRRPSVFEKVAKLRKRETSLVEAEKLEGTHDVIRKLGYTVITQDHYEFPPEVIAPPDQGMIRDIVADLKIALEEIKLYNYNSHPCAERFSEGFDWARKTTPILHEIKINQEITKFDRMMEDVMGVGSTHTPPTTPRNNSVAPNTIPPADPPNPPLPPLDTPRAAPRTSMYNPPQQAPVVMERQGRNRLDTYDSTDKYPEIPHPIPETMMYCPDDKCKQLIPKNSVVCPICRIFLAHPPSTESVESETPTLVPIEPWNCINCTLVNTTARGRPRICEICEKVNPIHIPTEVDPTDSLNEPRTRQYSGEATPPFPTPQQHPLQSKASFEMEQEPLYTQRGTLRNLSVNPPSTSSMNPSSTPSMNAPGNLTMNPPRNPTINPNPTIIQQGNQYVDSRGFSLSQQPGNIHGEYPQYGNQTVARDWDQHYPTYVDRELPGNPQGEYVGYTPRDPTVNPKVYGQLEQSIYDTPPNYAHPRRDRNYTLPPMHDEPRGHHPHITRNDSLGRIDTSLVPRRPFGAAMYHQQKSKPHPHSQMIPAPAPIPPYKFIKQIISQNHGFGDEALQLSIRKNGVHNSLDWLSKQFHENINILTHDVHKFELCNTVTRETVEENYIACQGVVPNVPTRIQDTRKKKLAELMETFEVSQELAIAALNDENWEVPAALDHMILLQNQQQLDNCIPSLWSGGMTIPERQPDEIDNEILEQLKLLANTPTEMNNKISRKYLSELKIPSLTQLNLLLYLMIDKETKEKEPKDLLQAVQEVSDYNAALKFLNQECHVCLVEYTANEMIQMFFCNHMFCRACVKLHFEHVVRNAAIKKWTCPECGEPDIQQMEDPSEYFGLLSTVVQALCEHDVTDLYHQKLNEFAISKRPEFRWCPHCHSGFLGQEGVKKLRCPQEECNQYLCYICKRKWEAEHEGRSCEEYQQWREVNDRDILDKGLAAKLVEEGIECPSCKFKYELARGGCMHFRCTQCPAEFCSGCFQLFKKENCTRFASCAKKGLHAHHPRNCQYNTRDMEIVKMKELLEKGGFQRDEAVVPEPVPEGAIANPVARKKPQIYKVKVPDEHRKAVIEELTAKAGEQFKEPPQGELKIPCQIVEYKDNPDGDFEKENCSRFSLEKDGYAGLCDKHYKEYLCGLITKAGLDPIDVLVVTDETIFELYAILKRNEIPYDEKMKGDQVKLFIKEKLPLKPVDFSGALQA